MGLRFLEKRIELRIPVELPILILSSKQPEPIQAFIVNLSTHGAWVRCATNIKVGDTVRIEWDLSQTRVTGSTDRTIPRHLARAYSDFQGEVGVVRWVGTGKRFGFGVEFLDYCPKRRGRFHDFLCTLKEMGSLISQLSRTA